ncbi:MAG: efflux RND transporter periplasmic adaptor subunit [Bacteroidota bacterium]
MKRVLILLCLIITFSACNHTSDKKAQLDKLIKEHDKLAEQISKLQKELGTDSGANKKIITVAITEVQPMVFKHYIEVQGKIDGDENVAVSARGMGVVTSVNVEEGQKVTKGQLLATLDAQVMYTQLADLEGQSAFVTDMYNRQKNLWDQKIGSEVQYLTAKNNKESLENKIKTLKDQIATSRITSPINGTIEEIPIKIGQQIAPGMLTFRVVNFNKIKVVADVAEAYSPKIKSNDSVLVYFPDFNEVIATRLSFTSKYINPLNRTFSIEAKLGAMKQEVRANMIAVVKINDYKANNAYAVPANVVQKSMNESFVYVAVVDKGKKIAKKQTVTLGMNYNGLIEVLSGLKTGDKVITTGYQDVNPNSLINF